MLSSHDDEIVRRDSFMPGLAIVLDAEAFLNVLRDITGEKGISAVQPNYLRYKPHITCLVGYEVSLDGSKVAVHARAYASSQRERLEKARHAPHIAGALGQGRYVLDQLGLVISVFPNDAKIKSLGYLGDGNRRSVFLRRMAGITPELAGCELRPIRYRPERRFIAQACCDDTVWAAVKLYTSAAYARAHTSGSAFRSRDVLAVSRLIRKIDRHYLLAFDWMPGRLLADELESPMLQVDVLTRVGRALAELHAQAARLLRRLPRVSPAERLIETAESVAFLHPESGIRARKMAALLADALVAHPAGQTAIHGDFYAKQVLLDEKKVAVIDLDEATIGDPASDLGNFLAHLYLDAVRGRLPEERVQSISEAFLVGYRSLDRSTSPEQIDLHTATALTQLLLHPFRQRDPNWPEKTDAILERVESIVDRLLSPRAVNAVEAGPPPTAKLKSK
jgi:Ser/Thr protein kinase RdoA (MazF antagonist)